MKRRSQPRRKPHGPAPEGTQSRYARKREFCDRRGVDARALADVNRKPWREQ